MGDSIDLTLYTLSPTTGFLPSPSPSARLPTYYDSWENFCDKLPEIIQQCAVRLHVSKLGTLDTVHLGAEQEWRRAYSILSYLVSAYVWTGEFSNGIIPATLANPYVVVCEHVKMPPVITYTGLILWNTKLIASEGSGHELDDLDVCRSFTGTSDERWFNMICSAIEAEAGPAIQLLLAATSAATRGDVKAVTDSLIRVQTTVQHLIELLQQLNTRVDPNIWYGKLRPYLAGGIDDRLEQGISFDGGNTYVRLAGANAGQSSLFQFFDAVLSIEHKNDFAARMREYMPAPHVQFLRVVEKSASIRRFVLQSEKSGDLHVAYDGCLKELELFRNKHIQIVTRYIMIPARTAARNAVGDGVEEKQPAKQEFIGVGGAPLMPFLRGMRDETRESAVTSNGEVSLSGV